MSGTSIQTRNDAILGTLQPYVVATPQNLACLDTAPFGLETRWHFDPTRTASATFLDLLQRLDGLTFGPEGMPMDKWVFYNCAELPGAIYGFAADAAELSPREREVFELPSTYAGPVPFSMYIAIPMHEEGAWFGHNLASLNRTFPERGLGGLGTVTKAIALKVFRAREFFGATQWQSRALYIHSKFGPLDLFTAYTPAHSVPETLTYGFRVTDTCIRAAYGDPTVELERPAPTMHLDASDVGAMCALQRELEAGARYQLVNAPSLAGTRVVHQLCEVPDA